MKITKVFMLLMTAPFCFQMFALENSRFYRYDAELLNLNAAKKTISFQKQNIYLSLIPGISVSASQGESVMVDQEDRFSQRLGLKTDISLHTNGLRYRKYIGLTIAENMINIKKIARENAINYTFIKMTDNMIISEFRLKLAKKEILLMQIDYEQAVLRYSVGEKTSVEVSEIQQELFVKQKQFEEQFFAFKQEKQIYIDRFGFCYSQLCLREINSDIRGSIRDNSEFILKIFELQAAENDYQVQKTSWMPVVNVFVERTYLGEEFPFNRHQTSAGFSISLGTDFLSSRTEFSGGVSEPDNSKYYEAGTNVSFRAENSYLANLINNSDSIDVLKITLENMLVELKEKEKALLSNLNFSYDMIDSMRKNLQLVNRKHSDAQIKFSLGEITAAELQKCEYDMLASKFMLLESTIRYRSTVLEIMNLYGEKIYWRDFYNEKN